MNNKVHVMPIRFLPKEDNTLGNSQGIALSENDPPEEKESGKASEINRKIGQRTFEKMVSDYNSTWLKAKLMDIDCYNRMAIENQKAENKKSRDEAIERNRRNRLLAGELAFENGNGYLCIEKCFPDMPSITSKPLINAQHLKLSHVVDIGNTIDIFLLTWDGHGYEVIEDNTKAFIQRLNDLGIPILVGRDRKTSVAESILDFLKSKVVQTRIPKFMGWNMTENGWHFVDNNEMTVDTLINGEWSWKK